MTPAFFLHIIFGSVFHFYPELVTDHNPLTIHPELLVLNT
jgi:hypothetical protein